MEESSPTLRFVAKVLAKSVLREISMVIYSHVSKPYHPWDLKPKTHTIRWDERYNFPTFGLLMFMVNVHFSIIKVNKPNVGKYTVRPMDGMGHGGILTYLGCPVGRR